MSRFLAVINVLNRKPGHPDNTLPGGGGYPDQGLPGSEGPVDPGYGVGPVDPGYGVPLPPVIDNGLPGGGNYPDQGLPPTFPVEHPDNGLPSAPGIWPKPPLGIWPPKAPIYPSHPIYPVAPGSPDQGLPEPGQPGTPGHLPALPPGSVWPPLPPEIGGPILCFCWVVGVGYRWVVLDPSLNPGFPERPTHPIAPGSGKHPDNALPGNKPQPK